MFDVAAGFSDWSLAFIFFFLRRFISVSVSVVVGFCRCISLFVRRHVSLISGLGQLHTTLIALTSAYMHICRSLKCANATKWWLVKIIFISIAYTGICSILYFQVWKLLIPASSHFLSTSLCYFVG